MTDSNIKKPTNKSCLVSTILVISMVLISSASLMAQGVSKAILYKTWKLEKYNEEGEYYAPEDEEKEDYLQFKADMTFSATMEGEDYSGTWMLNTNGKYIELKYKDKEVDKLRIKFLTDVTLVVIFDLDYYRYTEVHYASCN